MAGMNSAPYQRVQTRGDDCAALEDPCAARIMTNGLRLKITWPVKVNYGGRSYLPPEAAKLVQDLLLQGTIPEVVEG